MRTSLEAVHQLVPVDQYALPAPVVQELWLRSGKYTTEPPLMPNEFSGLWVVDHGDNSKSYVAHQRSVYDIGDGNPHIELDTYVVDVDENDKQVGLGE